MNQPTIEKLLDVVWQNTPETWTHMKNLESEWALRMMFQLKLAGWNWRDIDHVAKLLVIAEKRQVIRRDGVLLARWRRPERPTEV